MKAWFIAILVLVLVASVVFVFYRWNVVPAYSVLSETTDGKEGDVTAVFQVIRREHVIDIESYKIFIRLKHKEPVGLILGSEFQEKMTVPKMVGVKNNVVKYEWRSSTIEVDLMNAQIHCEMKNNDDELVESKWGNVAFHVIE